MLSSPDDILPGALWVLYGPWVHRSSSWLAPLSLICAGMVGILVHDIRRLPDGNTHVHILDVGQGSSALIVGPTGKRVVVDGGPDFSALQELGQALPILDRRIDLVVLSHPDLDHLAALPELLRRYDVRGILLAGVEKPLPRYTELLQEVVHRKIPVLFPDPRTDIDLGGGAVLDVAWPPESAPGMVPLNVNDTSIVLRVLFGMTSVLLPGDLEERGERAILQSGADLQSDVLIVGHHGSRTSTSTGFLLAARPQYAVISVGRENPFGHPHPSILRRLHAFSIPVLRTDQGGTMRMTLDGETVHISGYQSGGNTASRW